MYLLENKCRRGNRNTVRSRIKLKNIGSAITLSENNKNFKVETEKLHKHIFLKVLIIAFK